jgi:transposase-like protein
MGRKHSAEFKAKVALSAIKAELTMAEMISKYEIHRSLITNWRKQACDGVIKAFKEKPDKNKKDKEELIDELYKQIGQLKVENEWLKKKAS